ncbi:Sensory transduction protein regX3 [Arthrobacter sp. SO5]|uniref:response regulator transcription factor n=1 Tax=Arthrobacter sp. SO5 TaxID=1897055 RepID=UPI001E4F9E7D|nr:response regulator transcription factor [Arthrobacter sp. SO5]MCB5275348.1 Sensory transduction protein regX3 [Arthrobacter sp. SO5]
MRILVVEDDDAVASGVVEGLIRSGFEADRVATGSGALDAVHAGGPDFVILDLGLPDMDGTDVCREIRALAATPIIVVSARDEEIDRVLALELGADDYLVKPFGMRELIARIRAVTRRTQDHSADGQPPAGTTRNVGPLSIDQRSRRVLLSGTEINFTTKEFELLYYLAEEPGTVFPRNEIVRAVWDTNWFGTTKTLDAHVAAIRKKLGDPRWLTAVRGVGFRLEVPG